MNPSTHSSEFLLASTRLVEAIDPAQLDAMARGLAELRSRNGRLFILGVGGGAGHASHAVNDFRKLCLIESYAPTDNVSELTARTNDEGWETSFSAWLEISRISSNDAVLAFSVGGGSREHNVSVNLVNGLEAAAEAGASIYGVVGGPGGRLAELANVAVVIEPPASLRTPLVESLQALVWHGLVSHPELAARQGKWESLTARSGAVTGRPAVFLDRDGVLCELVPDPRSGRLEGPLTVEQVRLIPGAAAAAGRLADANRALICVTNQPAAAKGVVSVEQLRRVHQRVLDMLAAEGVAFDGSQICLHHPDGVVAGLSGECDCRKPAPGMLLRSARELGLDLRRSWMIGDTDADVAAGRAAGCRTILIANPDSSHRRSGSSPPKPPTDDLTDHATGDLADVAAADLADAVVDGLAHAADLVLASRASSSGPPGER